MTCLQLVEPRGVPLGATCDHSVRFLLGHFALEIRLPAHCRASAHFFSEISHLRCARDLWSGSTPRASGFSAASFAHSSAFSFPGRYTDDAVPPTPKSKTYRNSSSRTYSSSQGLSMHRCVVSPTIRRIVKTTVDISTITPTIKLTLNILRNNSRYCTGIIALSATTQLEYIPN